MGGGRRNFHAEDQARRCRQQQSWPKLPTRRGQDQRGNLDAESGEAQHADDQRCTQNDGRNGRDLVSGGDAGVGEPVEE